MSNEWGAFWVGVILSCIATSCLLIAMYHSIMINAGCAHYDAKTADLVIDKVKP